MVVLQNGANSFSSEVLVGRTVGEVFDDEILAEHLSLTGNETVRVLRGGTWLNADEYTTVQDGDHVSFSRVEGTKGL